MSEVQERMQTTLMMNGSSYCLELKNRTMGTPTAHVTTTMYTARPGTEVSDIMNTLRFGTLLILFSSLIEKPILLC